MTHNIRRHTRQLKQHTNYIDPSKNDPYLHISEMPGASMRNK